MHAYEQWKAEARKAIGQLKTDISESQLAILMLGKRRQCNECINKGSKLRYSTHWYKKADWCCDKWHCKDSLWEDLRCWWRLWWWKSKGASSWIAWLSSAVSHISSKSSTPISQPALNSMMIVIQIEASSRAAKEAEYAPIVEEKEQMERIQLLEGR